MIQIIIANQEQHTQPIRELFWEYLQWANAKVEQEFGVSFDIAAMLEDDMNTLDKFMPPKGRLLLGYVEDRAMGIACLKALTESIGEVKRMYVRPEARNKGLGRALLNRLLEEAIINSMVAGEDMTGHNGFSVKGLPHGKLKEIMRHYHRVV